MTQGGDWKDLLKAAGQGDVQLTRYHLREGTDPNFQHPEYFTCPIFEAIRNGHKDIVRILVEEGKADPCLMEELTDQTPIEVALEERQHDIVDYISTKLPQEYQRQWKPRQVLVTGGNRGLGKAICALLLQQGHRVIFTCRCKEDGDKTLQELKITTHNRKVDYILGDLGSIQSTKALAKAIQERFPTINVLIQNAGIWPTQKTINEDGLEMAFMVNYLAPYILTRELYPLLEQNGPSRVVIVNDKLYMFGKADLFTTPYGKDFTSIRTYMSTKQCGVLFLLNCARKMKGSKVALNAIHPGFIQTGLGNPSNSCLGCILRVVKSFWSSKPADGSIGPVWLAVSPEAEGVHGQFYDGMNQHQLLVGDSSVLDSTVQTDWEQWTEDFLAREERK
jgi:NAD(P)-dependent dehydrogenase (short-subunit alcohol dehydrogenase family)